MLKLDKNQVEEGIGTIIKAANGDVLEDIKSLAEVLKSDGDNSLKEKLLEQCNKFQAIYNDSFRMSVDELVKEFKKVFDITEGVERADVGEVSSIDASFKANRVDTSKVRL